MRNRIDQFGVAQPNINPDADRGIITVELPGIQDKDRVRKYLQSSANLQFWEVYNISELGQSITKADDAFFTMMGGKSAKTDSTKSKDSTAVKQSTKVPDSTNDNNQLKTLDAGTPAQVDDTSNKTAATPEVPDEQDPKKHLYGYISFITQPIGKHKDGTDQFASSIGSVPINDTALVRGFLQSPAVSSQFPSQLVWMYGIPERDKNNKPLDFVPLYAIKTYGRDKAPIEGDAVREARADFGQTGAPEVSMEMTDLGRRDWGKMTTDNHNKPIAIVLDNIVYSAPNVDEPITTGSSRISGGFTVQEAQDLARILNGGKYPGPC